VRLSSRSSADADQYPFRACIVTFGRANEELGPDGTPKVGWMSGLKMSPRSTRGSHGQEAFHAEPPHQRPCASGAPSYRPRARQGVPALTPSRRPPARCRQARIERARIDRIRSEHALAVGRPGRGYGRRQRIVRRRRGRRSPSLTTNDGLAPLGQRRQVCRQRVQRGNDDLRSHLLTRDGAAADSLLECARGRVIALRPANISMAVASASRSCVSGTSAANQGA